MVDVFEKRLRRAEQLAKEWPFAAEILGFSRTVLEVQQWASERFSPGDSFPQSSDDALLRLAHVLERSGPPAMAAKAGELQSWKQDRRELLLRNCLQFSDERAADSLLEFFARAALQPWVSRDAPGDPTYEAAEGKPQLCCAHCGQPPIVSVLREDKSAEAVRRSLVCSLCSREWDFPRVLCPSCKEERPEKLPRYSAQETPWMRIEACDSCGKYLKSVDLTLNWEAEPVVDELASTPLDVIAHEHGYTKIAPNLAGI
jgi:formate dehydrogenase accessory protein FdhE